MKRKYISQDQESGQTYPAMQEVKHTPTPWKIAGDNYIITDDYTIALTNVGTRHSVVESIDKANAAFIVRAIAQAEGK